MGKSTLAIGKGTTYPREMRSLLTVHEVADLIGIAPDTVRRWEKKGLIKGQRSNHNHRLFNPDEVRRLHEKISGATEPGEFKVLKTRKKSPYTAIDLFAGAGGTALGLENAGIEHSLLLDYEKDAVATLRKNFSKREVVEEDIRKFSFKGMEADLIEGGFPCQAFSTAGKKRGFEDTRGTLFHELARSIKEVQPKVFMAENVKGLINHDEGKTLAVILSTFKQLGYNIAYRILRAQYLDVPQKRERIVILGVRNDLDLPLLFPKEKNYTISLKEALHNCPVSFGQQYPERKKEILALVPPGGYWRDLPVTLQKEYMQSCYYMTGGKTGMARRLSWDEPSLTLTCAPAQKQTERCHPKETRPLTVREYARIQTFPDSWEFAGSMASQYKQIGNAVPVNMGYHIGQCIVAMLNETPDLKRMEIAEAL